MTSPSRQLRRILKYAEDEFDKAIKTRDILLYRNAVDKAFLAMIIAVNSYINGD
ncbi:MAG: hypothetical protein QXD04_06490 [Candidatus Bathyarchaeia archaeon]